MLGEAGFIAIDPAHSADHLQLAPTSKFWVHLHRKPIDDRVRVTFVALRPDFSVGALAAYRSAFAAFGEKFGSVRIRADSRSTCRQVELLEE
jgi:hypothetical protein